MGSGKKLSKSAKEKQKREEDAKKAQEDGNRDLIIMDYFLYLTFKNHKVLSEIYTLCSAYLQY